jgi:flagellar biosynthesis/type III secretory pathway chaperone
MNVEKPNNEYFIIYSNYLIFENQTLAFRKKELFNITNIPKLIDFNNNANCWIINRKQLTVKKAKELLINEHKTVDVSDLQWYRQIQLDAVFNLK